LIASRQPRIIQAASRRYFADESPKPTPGTTQSGIGHVSEEAVDVGNITGETTPDLDQGTPVQEVCWLNCGVGDVMTSETLG